MASAKEVTVPFIKKKGRSRPTTTRQRSASPGPSEISATNTATAKSEVVLPPRKNANRLISAGTKRTASRSDEDDAEEEEERDGPGMKWTAEGSHINAAKAILLDDETEELLAKRHKAENPDGDDDDDVPDDGLYRGQKGYTNHIKKRQEVPKAMRVGPQRNTSTIRTVTIVDYQPDVCKDYKGVWFMLWIPETKGLT